MRNRYERDEEWRRFDEEEDFDQRAGALDRRWGYGSRLSPNYHEEGQFDRDSSSEFSYSDPYNAPDYWIYQEEWMRPGPHTGKGPRGYQRSDARIFEDVCDRLAQHAKINAQDIKVEVNNGEVQLTGRVDDRRMKYMVEDNIELIPGVVDIHNNLKVNRPGRERKGDYGDRLSPFPGGPTPTGPAGYDPDRI